MQNMLDREQKRLKTEYRSTSRPDCVTAAYSSDSRNDATLFQARNVTRSLHPGEMIRRSTFLEGTEWFAARGAALRRSSPRSRTRRRLCRIAANAFAIATRRQGNDERGLRESRPRRRRQRDDEMPARHVAASPWKTTRPGSRMRD